MTHETKDHIFYSDGRVYSKYKKNFMKFHPNSDGYLQSRLFFNGKVRNISMHRIVALTFIPNPENKKEVNHKDGNKLNNDISNLEWVTGKENIRHAILNGLVKHPKGDYAGNSKLKEWQVLAIRWLYKYYGHVYAQQDLANSFNISRSQVSKITLGNSRI